MSGAAAGGQWSATWSGGHAMIVEFGDMELHARCQCGHPFGVIRPDKSLDNFAGPWERHVLTQGSGSEPPGSAGRTAP